MKDTIVQITAPNDHYTMHSLGESGNLYALKIRNNGDYQWDLLTKSPELSGQQRITMPNNKKIRVKFDDKKLTLTDEYIEAIKSLLRAEIHMMREKDGNAECWVYGVANIGDLAKSDSLEFYYGGEEDKEWLEDSGQIMVHVPLEQ